jgi:hypothetical protein
VVYLAAFLVARLAAVLRGFLAAAFFGAGSGSAVTATAAASGGRSATGNGHGAWIRASDSFLSGHSNQTPSAPNTTKPIMSSNDIASSFDVFSSYLRSFARTQYLNIFCVAMQHKYLYNNHKEKQMRTIRIFITSFIEAMEQTRMARSRVWSRRFCLGR